MEESRQTNIVDDNTYDIYWDDDERSKKMINYYKKNNTVEEKFIPISKILKELYDEEKDILYCNDSSEYSFTTFHSYIYSSDEEYSDYEEDIEYITSEAEVSDKYNQNENITDLVNKFYYI